MRAFKLLAMAGLAMSTAACVETVDSNYGYGNGYYAPNQAYGQSAYYGQPAYAPTYAPTYYAPTQVVTQTRYVPVPVAVPQHTFAPQDNRSNDRRGEDRHDHPQASNTPAPHPQQPAGNNQQHRGGNDSNTDRDHDGRPDRRS